MHKFREDDIVLVFNQNLNRETIYEGKARIVKSTEVHDQYVVEFAPGDHATRFVYFGSGAKLPPELQKVVNDAKQAA